MGLLGLLGLMGLMFTRDPWDLRDLRDLRDLETQDKTQKVRVMLTARQTMSDWNKLRWEEAYFSENNFPFQIL